MARFKDKDWNLPVDQDGNINAGHVEIAVLMDIRDELKRLNELLHCRNFINIPVTLSKIERNTTKKRKPKVKKAS